MRAFKCNRCGTFFEVGPGDKRKIGQCFKCGETFTLPSSRARKVAISSIGVGLLLATGIVFYLAFG